MSEETGGESTQNSQEAQGSQSPDTSKVFSKGYNEGVSTQERRVVEKISKATGNDFSDIDDVYGWAQNSSKKLAESVSDPTETNEYKELQSKVNEYKQQATEAQNMAQNIQNQYKFDSTYNEVVSSVKESNNFKIPESDVKDLFNAKHQVEYKDGKPVVKKGDMPLMTDDGEYKPLSDAIKDFAKSYIEPATSGTGGGSGDGATGAKPKYEDFMAAKNNKDYDKMEALFNQADQSGGWAEKDAPSL